MIGGGQNLILHRIAGYLDIARLRRDGIGCFYIIHTHVVNPQLLIGHIAAIWIIAVICV